MTLIEDVLHSLWRRQGKTVPLCRSLGAYYATLTNNPSEREQRIDCARCGGTGFEPDGLEKDLDT
jgi:hypothetical protein